MPAITSLRRTIRQATPALALGTAALTATLAACSDSPTGPTPAPAATRVAAASVAPSLAPAPTTTSAGTWVSLSQAQLDALMADLLAFHAAIVPIPAPAPATGAAPTSGQSATATATAAAGAALACRAEHGWSATQTIGARGGTLHIGPHQFTVPAGALDHDVTITATSTGSTARGLDFAPHGLQFLKPVSMTISFAGCQVPEGSVLGVVYTDPSGRPLQRMPAHADHPAHQITALTDHFSGYLVSTGRN